MKLFFLIFLFLSGICSAQNSDSLTLNELEIPNAPGFILLDEAPTSIERPNSVKAFTVGIFNSFGQSNGFPKNYALEITPFWFFKHGKNMSALRYLGVQKGNFSSAIKTVSLSLAYINKTDTLTNKPVNNIAVGARFNLFKIYSKKQRADILDAYKLSVHRLQGLNALLDQAGATPTLLVTEPDKYNAIVREVMALIAKKDSVSALKNAVNVRPLVALDGALAYSTVFSNNDYSTHSFGRFGSWLTLNFAFELNKKQIEKQHYFNLYLVSRYLTEGMSRNSLGEIRKTNFFDYGGKLEFEFKKLSLGYELIARTSKYRNTYRSTGNIRFKIQDNLYITGAFGRNFGDANNLVSLLGINWGLMTGNEKLSQE